MELFKLAVPRSVVGETIAILRAGGQQNCETVVFWLGRDAVQEVFRPEQEVDVDYFRIPNSSMRLIMTHLRMTRQRMLAQVHSHPEEAYHSQADDRWAVIRHEGALSLVLPHFARHTDESTFLLDAAAFRLSANDEWLPVPTPSAISLT